MCKRLMFAMIGSLILLCTNGQKVPACYPCPCPCFAPAVIFVKLPADAKLFIDGEATTSKGTERVFVSPPLPCGYEFEYTLRLEVNRAADGKDSSDKGDKKIRPSAKPLAGQVDDSDPNDKGKPQQVTVVVKRKSTVQADVVTILDFGDIFLEKETEVERDKSKTSLEGQGLLPFAIEPFSAGSGEPGVQFISAAVAVKQYSYACKINRGNGWETYRQTCWKNYCDNDDKNRMLDLRDRMRKQGIPAKVVEREREVN